VEQVVATIFTDSTRSFCAFALLDDPAPLGLVPDELELGSTRPVIDTSWFRCGRSSEASPSSTYRDPMDDAAEDDPAPPVPDVGGGEPAADDPLDPARAEIRMNCAAPPAPDVAAPAAPDVPAVWPASSRQPVTVTLPWLDG
jgi:hypothetical protein